MSYTVHFVDAGFENHKKKVITLNKIPIRTIVSAARVVRES